MGATTCRASPRSRLRSESRRSSCRAGPSPFSCRDLARPAAAPALARRGAPLRDHVPPLPRETPRRASRCSTSSTASGRRAAGPSCGTSARRSGWWRRVRRGTAAPSRSPPRARCLSARTRPYRRHTPPVIAAGLDHPVRVVERQDAGVSQDHDATTCVPAAPLSGLCDTFGGSDDVLLTALRHELDGRLDFGAHRPRCGSPAARNSSALLRTVRVSSQRWSGRPNRTATHRPMSR